MTVVIAMRGLCVCVRAYVCVCVRVYARARVRGGKCAALGLSQAVANACRPAAQRRVAWAASAQSHRRAFFPHALVQNLNHVTPAIP